MNPILRSIAIQTLPKLYTEYGQRIEKLDITTQVLKHCYKNEVIRKTWKPFIKNVISFYKDGIKEAEDALAWSDNSTVINEHN